MAFPGEVCAWQVVAVGVPSTDVLGGRLGYRVSEFPMAAGTGP